MSEQKPREVRAKAGKPAQRKAAQAFPGRAAKPSCDGEDLRRLTSEAILAAPSILEVRGETADLGVLRVSTDTREDLHGALFIPLRGENFDGEDFLLQAYRAGARVLAYTREDSYGYIKARIDGPLTMLRVRDGLEFYGDLARSARLAHGFELIAVTGSVGKTSCRQWITAVLERMLPVSGTKANLNNRIGVAQSVFALDPAAQVAVLELGMDEAGEIAFSSRMVLPNRGVITNVGTSHLAHFPDRSALAAAKFEILEGMAADAPLHLRWDEDLLSRAVEKMTSAERERVRLYAGRRLSVHELPPLPLSLAYYENGALTLRLYEHRVLYAEYRLNTQAVEPHHLAHFAAAAQIAAAYGALSEERLIAAIYSYRNEPGRLSRHLVGDYTLIDDAYNASPESMRAAFESLRYHGVRNAVACLAAVNELGADAPALHVGIGEALASAEVFRLAVLLPPHSGDIQRGIANVAARTGKKLRTAVCRDLDEMYTVLQAELQPGDTVLFKGSNSFRLSSLRRRLEEDIHA